MPQNGATETRGLRDRIRRARPAIAFAIEIGVIAAAALLAFLLRFDFSVPANYLPVLIRAAAVWIPVKLLCFKAFGLDRRWARYVSINDLLRVILSNSIGSFVALIVLWAIKSGVPRSIYAIDWLVCVMLTASLRLSVRVIAESRQRHPAGQDRKRTIVYGAGDAGAALLRELRQNAALTYDVFGFLDDDPRKAGLVLHGLRVLGSGGDLAALARKQRVDLVLIAIPSASGSQMKAILERCTGAGVPYKTIPGLAEIIEEHSLARQIRDVAVEDLLGRVPVNLDQERISAKVRDRVILVTGAAGSIGSELCRQIARFQPTAIVGFEIAESPLFHLQLEIARSFPGIRFHAEIGSIQNRARLEEVFARHRPSVVYHAAAYKHVPLMESHAFEAFDNNVIGTLNVVEAARAREVREFVMISSDKAVRPANIMGVTKRIAEMLVRSLQPGGGSYVSVRFGNVLGSNGSVVPVFKDQIERGGPVTVTHPEMRRYFMTIPEACQLVLQASTMGRGGEIFVLDMGEPVRIVDLARNLILLSGLRPEQDIRIEFVGTRPGEKLYEELSAAGEDLLPTQHAKIRVFGGAMMPWMEIQGQIGRARLSSRERRLEDLVLAMKELVPDYSPGANAPGIGMKAGV
jgi:FlaA1/EpsC-like NDP-sugar epimerase